MNWNQEEEEENDLSLSRFEAMLKTNKVFFFDSEEFESIILYYLDTGKTNLAKRALKLGLEQHPKSTGIKLVQVEILVYEEKLDIAEKMLNELCQVEPTNEEIYIQKATIFSKRGNHKKAIESLEIALEHTDDYADVYSLIGREYLIMDDLEKAKEHFIKCLEADEYDNSSLFNVIYCFDFLEQREQAVAFLNRFVDRNPYNEIAWHQLGRQYSMLKEYKLALRAYDLATVVDDTFISGYTEKARALQDLERYEEAIACYNFALELDDDPSPYTYFRLGGCYEGLQNKDSALGYYTKSVEEDPLMEEGWLAIIDLYIKEEDIDTALSYIDKALDIDNENIQYWKHYANLHYTLENYPEAFIGYEKVLEYGPFDLQLSLFFVDMCIAFGEFDKAIAEFESFTEFNIEDPQIEYRLAGLYYSIGSLSKAKSHLKKALTLSFEDFTVLSKLFPKVYQMRGVQRLMRRHWAKHWKKE